MNSNISKNNRSEKESSATTVLSETTLRQTLRQIFGHDSFRPNQEEIVRAILQGRDVFAVMPTGGGKSLCYQLPAVVANGVCVVVSPLLALMKDQVDGAREMGIRAETLNSTTSSNDFARISRSFEADELDLLYISPERFNTDGFLHWLERGNVAFFAIDEAHCISQWGRAFRADYLALSKIVQEFPNVPIAAFTATATDFVSNDVVTQLGLRNPFSVRASFDRPNLYYRVVYKTNPTEQLTAFLNETNGESGIVYCGTRKKVEQTTEFLVRQGFAAQGYHAGLADEERTKIQEAFVADETQIIVATVAFGMGIDKSNVRFVVHLDLPKNLESYYQETGRAGRDGSPARCLLLFGYQDVLLQRAFVEEIQDETLKKSAYEQLNEMVRFAESDRCRRKSLLKYFDEEYPKENCAACDCCNGDVVREDATIESQKALSAIVRTGGRFGAGQIVDIVVGANTEKIRRFGHDKLPTWGVGKDRDKNYWRRLMNALALQGITAVDPRSEFPVPQITELGRSVLKGERKVEITAFPTLAAKKKAKSSADRREIAVSKTPEDQATFERLRSLRSELARKRGVPPYVIFSDKSLWDMIRVRPTSRKEFLNVAGVGESKANAYADVFVAALRRTN